MEDRLKFATPPIFCRAGFDRILLGLAIPSDTIEPLYAAFEKGHRVGDPRLLIKLITVVLDGIEWSWPWLERCAAEFQERGEWPIQWKGLYIAPPLIWDRLPIGTQIEMLARTLSAAAHSEHTWNQMNDESVAKVFMPILISTSSCVPSNRMATQYRNALIEGDRSKLPPLFPCDLISLFSEWRDPAKRKSL